MRNIFTACCWYEVTAIQKALRFVVVGAVAAIINLVAMFLFAMQIGDNWAWQRNLSNFIALVIGTTVAFLLNRCWTWDDSPKKKGKNLFYQYLLYCSSAGLGAILRICLFAVLDSLTSVHYLVNVMIGIGAAAVLDFFLYSKFVFRSHS